MKKLIAASALFLLGSPLFADIYSVGIATSSYTSDFMMGKVVVAIVFPESSGATDPNMETWSEARKTQAISEIMAGHQWWTKQNPRSPLSFTYVVRTLPTRYEPITRPYYHEQYWIPDTLASLGYSGTRFTATRDYANDLRKQFHTDWAFIIFVVDSQNDYDGKFSDGYFAYAYLGGPFIVMTYDNGGYGITNMDVVAAHESGHIFNALDEYAGASGPSDYSFGYFPTINGNHEWSAIANDTNSIMRGGLRWGLDAWAKLMIGWRDLNNNNVDDILDQTPEIVISPQTQSSQGQTVVQGEAKISVLPRQGNSNGYGMTLDTIAKVEYRFGADGEWTEASPVDGNFNGAKETFQISVPQSTALNIQASAPFNPASVSLEVRAKTLYSMNAGAGTGPQVTSAGALANAHPFPNPYKPNSSLGHTAGITFTGLTSGSKVQIFTPSGEPVFDAESPTGAPLPWTAVDTDGKNVSSGVYMYLITDPTGNKKKGKLAVIR
jgi:hypothetical protein